MVSTQAIGQAAGGANGTATTASLSQSAMGKEQFLTLLLAQLKNQDPLSPMENTEFTAQMAQFSSLEQLFGINENLKGIQNLSASMESSQAVNIIGKQIEATGNKVTVSNGQASELSFTLPESASAVQVNVRNQNGDVVRTIERNGLDAGQHQIAWDGIDSRGSKLGDGIYNYTINAKDNGGNSINAQTYTRGIVDAVTMEDGITYLHAGNQKVTMGEVTKIIKAPGGAVN